MSKSLLNLLVQISKALVNSKNQFLIQKTFFFAFGPANLTGPLGLWPSQPRWPLSPCRPKPSSSAHLARASVASLRKYVFPFGSHLPSWSLLSRLSVKQATAVNSVFHPAPADPCCVATEFHHAAAPRAARSAPRDAARAITTPPSLPPPSLNPPLNLAPIFNGIKAINAAVTPVTTLWRPPAPIKAPEDPWSIPPLTGLVSSPLPRRKASPSSPPTTTAPPGRHTVARAPVSRPLNSPHSTPPLPPLGRRSWTPERPEAEAPASPVPPATAGPPWTEVGRVPWFRGPSPQNFCSKINPGKS
jgi:hypothetical protein